MKLYARLQPEQLARTYAAQDGETLAALRAEGEVLSRKSAEAHSTARKLRQSLRVCEAQRDDLKERVQHLEQEAAARLEVEQSVAENLLVWLSFVSHHNL